MWGDLLALNALIEFSLPNLRICFNLKFAFLDKTNYLIDSKAEVKKKAIFYNMYNIYC